MCIDRPSPVPGAVPGAPSSKVTQWAEGRAGMLLLPGHNSLSTREESRGSRPALVSLCEPGQVPSHGSSLSVPICKPGGITAPTSECQGSPGSQTSTTGDRWLCPAEAEMGAAPQGLRTENLLIVQNMRKAHSVHCSLVH